MHRSSLHRMRWFVLQYVAPTIINADKQVKVLDVGSCDTAYAYNAVFSDPVFNYVGLDMVPGKNVDLVLPYPYDWSTIPTDEYDVVISGQAFEHIEFFWVTFSEMVRVLKPGGLLCLIVPANYMQHRYPVDCYRFSTDAMVALVRYNCLQLLHASTDCAPSKSPKYQLVRQWTTNELQDTMLVAKKPYAGLPQYPDSSTYQCVALDHALIRGDLVPTKRNFSYSMRKLFYAIFDRIVTFLHTIRYR